MNTGTEELLAEGRPVPFVDFCRSALYGEGGYYRKERVRVGTKGADFYTNLSVRSVFGPLVLEAFRQLDPENGPEAVTFVEIGVEPGQSLFAADDHPFAAYVPVSLGDRAEPEGSTWVFANEWLDAQPFVSLVFRGEVWKELFVTRGSDGRLIGEEGAPESAEAIATLPLLPSRAFPDGYRVDFSPDAEKRIADLAEGRWRGVFLTVDYGRTWESLLTDFPAGTARAYRDHRQVADLLANPGEQDLTCDVVWDRLEAVLRSRGFDPVDTRRQEAFLMDKAASAVRALMADPALRPRLLQLLSPAHLGTSFQVLSAVRGKKTLEA